MKPTKLVVSLILAIALLPNWPTKASAAAAAKQVQRGGKAADHMIYLARATSLVFLKPRRVMLCINSVPVRIVAAGRLLFGRLDNLEIYSDLESCGRQRTRDDTCR